METSERRLYMPVTLTLSDFSIRDGNSLRHGRLPVTVSAFRLSYKGWKLLSVVSALSRVYSFQTFL